jgi:hypothetical protein
MDVNTATQSPVWLTFAESAEKARITPRYLHMRIADGTGPEVTKVGRRVLIREDRLDAWLDQQTVGREMQNMPPEITPVIADEIDTSLRHMMAGDPVAALMVFRRSVHPLHMHLAGAINGLAKIAAETPDPDAFLDVIRQVIARD